MTEQNLIDYCFMYWQHVSKKMLDLMKDYPCVYIDDSILIHSLTRGRDIEALCTLNVNPDDDVFLTSIGYKFHYDYVEKNEHTYLYDEIDDKTMDRFIGMVLYISHHENEIMLRMQNEIAIIYHIQKAVGK